jgi:hypothetical protein
MREFNDRASTTACRSRKYFVIMKKQLHPPQVSPDPSGAEGEHFVENWDEFVALSQESLLREARERAKKWKPGDPPARGWIDASKSKVVDWGEL